MDNFKISEETMRQLDSLLCQCPQNQDIIFNEWCKCTGMD